MEVDEQLRAEALQYDVEAMRNGIEKCKKNVELFMEAVRKEEEEMEAEPVIDDSGITVN